MQQKRFLYFALIMLMAGIGFMTWDMFFSKPPAPVNPYAYDLKSLKAGDTALIQYREVQQIRLPDDTIRGIATDRAGKIYAAGWNRVYIYLPDGSPAGSFPIDGQATCIQVDSAGIILVATTGRVGIYGRDGRKLREFNAGEEDAIITSVAASGKDIYAADAGHKVVCRYDRIGNLLKRIGEKDPQRNIPGFVIPSPYFDLAAGPGGTIWVVNPGRHSFEHFSPEGDLISSWGKASMSMDGFCGCCNPSHFAILADGSFVTSEKGIERIKIYSPEGNFICVVANSGSFTEGTRGLDLAVDSKGRIVVLDPERKQVRIFEIKK